MKLSNGEKLIIAMLADLYKHLQVKGDLDAELINRLVWGGDAWALAWKYDNLFNSEDPSDEVVKETADILTMWRVITQAFKALKPDDQARVLTATGKSELPKFEGFDANHDAHYGVLRVLVEDLGRFEELKSAPSNSHSSASLPRYRAMLQRYKSLPQGFGDKLDADGLISIFKRP